MSGVDPQAHSTKTKYLSHAIYGGRDHQGGTADEREESLRHHHRIERASEILCTRRTRARESMIVLKREIVM